MTDAIEFDWDNWDFETEDYEPVEYNRKQTKKIIAVVDCETDPFAPDFLIAPFAIGFRTPERYVDFWGDDCVEQFFTYLKSLDDKFIIYAHNGGKFDFFFFLDYLQQNTSPRIINGRLVQIYFEGQEFRDSYALIPEPLAAYAKDTIDYSNFTRDKRERFKPQILKYLQSDCDYLHELVTAFHDKFGDKLTAASSALAMLNSFHGFDKIKSDAIDEQFRSYYYGGRNQCFETGILKPTPGNRFIMVDRNSMYPSVMHDCLHPVSSTYELHNKITERTDFATIVAKNYGALPTRAENGSLDFTVEYGTFNATIHEINAGLETGTLVIEKVISAWEFDKKASFQEFVSHFYNSRLEAKANGDKLNSILYKLVMNSAYGKFALNPRKFKQWLMTIDEIPEPLASDEYPDGWTLHSNSGTMYIWERPSPRRGGFYNIATAASITGAARANLLMNIANSERPIYCDTDSILCEQFHGYQHDKELGAWKIEATGNLAAIAGKKLYALYDNNNLLKKASKGCSLTGDEILSICNGNEITYRNPVPSFHLHSKGKHSLGDIGSASFVTRTIRKTAHG